MIYDCSARGCGKSNPAFKIKGLKKQSNLCNKKRHTNWRPVLRADADGRPGSIFPGDVLADDR
ncbi:MAG: hypothetical protein B5M56_05555 [Desulfococcus sp. 4484_241]|nr:MAG: hypothetical protein B5M56_05555 [Desulfococcus sp. 4484_241]